MDSRIRNVWAEAPDAEAYIEAELSLGARLAWDSFFSWNPKTKIEGYVFEDKNSDGIKDKGESGIENVTIIIGPNETVSDKNGSFATSVRAKNVTINIDLSTVPDKYVLTTPASEKMDISKGGIKTVNFGLSSQSGIYGVIFYDINNNNKLDQEDQPIPQARLILDKDKETLTNNEGIYYFDNILPGKHTVKLGVNSLPLQYLPKLSIKKEITVEQGHTYTYHIPLGKK